MEALVTYLREHHPEVVPIACRPDDKHPRYQYKDGPWTWALWDASKLDGFSEAETPTDVLGVLIPHGSIVVVDFDSVEAMKRFEQDFPDLTSHTAVEKTGRGYHVWFAPSEHSRKLLTTSNSAMKIDVKAGYSTGTPAVCVVAPSPNKVWLQEPWTTGLMPMPEAVKIWLKQHVYRKHSLSLRDQEEAPAAAHANPQAEVDFAQVERVVMALGEDTYGPGSYETWLSVVHAVTNLGARAEREGDARELLHKFSKQSGAAYDGRVLEAKIRDARSGPGYGFPRLKRVLKQSNPAAYRTEFCHKQPPSSSEGSAAQGMDDLSAAECLYRVLDGDNTTRMTKRGFCYYDHETGMWTIDEKLQDIRRSVARLRAELEAYAGSSAKTDAMLKKLRDIVKKEPDFIVDRIDSGLGQLLFNDCIVDMATGERLPFDSTKMFMGRIDRPYNTNVDPVITRHVKQILFEDPFTAEQLEEGVGEYWARALADGVAGNYRRRNCYYGIGPKGTCKGTTTDAIIASFGTFCGIMNARSLETNPRGGDAAKCYSFLEDVWYKRCVFVNELKPTIVFDSALFRSLVSAGDKMMIRTNNINEYVVKPVFVPFFMGNDRNGFDAMDGSTPDRINGVVRYEVMFVNDTEGRNPALFKPRDDTVKDLFLRDDYRDAVVHLMLDAYKRIKAEGNPVPASVRDAKSEWFEEGQTMESKVGAVVEFTGDDRDFVVPMEVHAAAGLGADVSTEKVGMALKALNGVKDRKKVGGKVCRVWYRMRMRE